VTPLDRLIVVAAPSCCGKSTLIDGIRNNRYPAVTAQLRTSESDTWTYEDAFYVDKAFLRDLESSPARNMVLHWTIPRPGLKLKMRRLLTLNAYDRKERLTLLNNANDVTVLTLYATGPELQRRVAERYERVLARRSSGQDGFLKSARKRRNMCSLREFYSNMDSVVSIYDDWLRFCDAQAVDASFLVKSDADAELVPATEWPAVRQSLVNGE
jgi:hypothetical protein